MAFKDRSFYPAGISSYVPAMQYASALKTGVGFFSLGTPAASDDDLLHATLDMDAVAGVETAISWTADSTYGRNLIYTPSADPGAAGGVVDVYGYDYLGQPMTERFTGANGATAVLYGKKAFRSVYKTKIVTAATNAITAKLGTGTRLGLPYKGKILWAMENGVKTKVFDEPIVLTLHRDRTDAAAGQSAWLHSPCPGFISRLRGWPDGGGSTNDPAVTVELAGVAVVGLTVTIDTSNTAGLTVTDAPTTVGYSANNRLITDSLIEIVAAAAAGAFGDSIEVQITPTQHLTAVLTDPATVSTGDPRGTYEALVTLDDVIEILVAMEGDSTVNAAGNGGLHGIAHV